MKEQIEKLVRHRLGRSQSSFEEGVALFEKGFFAGAVNRFYYAAFYASRALLATKELDSSKHSGVISLFHEHFVRTNLFDTEKAKAFSRSFEQRLDSDYEDFSPVTLQEAETMMNQVREFIPECERVLKRL